MYNKMDHAKTTCLIFSHKNKETYRSVKLPVSITSMIAHYHGDIHYVHYGFDVFSHDSNYTIRSMARLLRDLEKLPTSSSRQLFVESGSTTLVKKVLKGVEMCQASLSLVSEALVLATPLPSILNVQMDNAIGDNKN